MNYRNADNTRTLLQGPQSDDQVRNLLREWSSMHQWQPCCDEHVIFVTKDQLYHLDHAAMTCVVEYLTNNHPHVPDLSMLRAMLASIKPPKPKPEPEVAAVLYRAPPKEAEAISTSTFEDEPEPRWKVRIRTKMERGGTVESVQLLERLADLVDLIEDGPYAGSTKHIKIKLEYLG